MRKTTQPQKVAGGIAAIIAFYGVMFVLTFIVQLVDHGDNGSDPNPYWHGNDFHVFWTKFLPGVAKWSLAPTFFFAAVVVVILSVATIFYLLDQIDKK